MEGARQKTYLATTNFNYMMDIEVLLSLACFIPILNVIHYLIKLSEARNVFICDFMQSIKVCQASLAKMFVDETTTFMTTKFQYY